MSFAYRRLLRLLPAGFRRQYGDEMCHVVEEHWHAVRPGVGPVGAVRFWLRQLLALLRVALTSRRERRGKLASPQVPRPPRGDRSGVMDGLLQDLRYSFRTLAKRPGFTLVTAVTLALGIGSSTAIFSAVHAVLLRDLPYGDVDRIVAVFHTDTETGERGQGLSAANARDLMENADSLTAAAVADPYSLDLQVEGRAESLRAWAVTEGFFASLDVEPYLGRVFAADEYVQDGEPVALLGYRSWRTRFGADASLVGSTLNLDGAPRTIVGVLPEDFKLPTEVELWIPRPVQPYDANTRAADYMSGFGRLAPGVTLAQAQAEVEQIAASLASEYPGTNATTSFDLVPLREFLFGDVQAPLLVLLGAVGFVLLIACANVAGLMLARGTERQREFALRGALGAGAGRLVRQVTIDSLLLAAIGCGLGIGMTYLGTDVIRSLGAEHLPRIEEIRVDTTVLFFAVGVAVLSALISGLVPSLRFSRPDLRGTLNEGGRGAIGDPGSRFLRNGIVVAEIAAAVVLLVGAGLLSRSFTTLLDRDLGFAADNRLAMQLFAYGYGEEGGMTTAEFVNRTIEEIEALPGVRRVALTSTIPSANDGRLASIDIDLPFTIVDRPLPLEGREPVAWVVMVSDGYLDVMDIPLVAGRTFDETDNAESPPVVLVNEAFVRRHFAGVDPLGEKVMIGFQQPSSREIVGVISDTLPQGYESEPRPEVYFPLRQQGTGSLTFVIASESDAAQLANPAMEAVWRVNPEQAVWGTATMDTLLGDWLSERRFNLMLLGGFAVVALVLAAIGIYGLISFSVEQRVAEMGIRRALGGQTGSIVGMVVREAEGLAVAGVAIGVAGALGLTRFIQGMLYGIGAGDPVTFVGLALAVLVVSGVAALLPALRATRIDPVTALRAD